MNLSIDNIQGKQLATSKQKIIFFDGVCNLCNSVVDFTMRNNAKKDICFASLQSNFAKDFLAEHNFDISELRTFFFYEKGVIYSRSDAALKLAKNLNTPYKIATIFLLIPKGLRDAAYNFIAKNRYRFFGKTDSCRLPTKEEQIFFL